VRAVKGSILLRVFFETADGGYYSPLISDCFELLPIPEFLGRFRKVSLAHAYSYSRIPCRCSSCYLSKYLPSDYVLVGGSSYHVSNVVAHWDPRFDIGVYCDYWRQAGGRIPKSFTNCREDCYIFFAAGLARYPPKFFNRPRGFTEIRRAFMRAERGIYIVAYMEVDEVVDLTEIAAKHNVDVGREGDDRVWEIAAKEYGEEVIMTPHSARGIDLPVVILSERGRYGYLKKPLPLILWSRGRRVLTTYSYLFNIKGFEDRVRHKVFDPARTEQIVDVMVSEGYL